MKARIKIKNNNIYIQIKKFFWKYLPDEYYGITLNSSRIFRDVDSATNYLKHYNFIDGKKGIHYEWKEYKENGKWVCYYQNIHNRLDSFELSLRMAKYHIGWLEILKG